MNAKIASKKIIKKTPLTTADVAALPTEAAPPPGLESPQTSDPGNDRREYDAFCKSLEKVRESMVWSR